MEPRQTSFSDDIKAHYNQGLFSDYYLNEVVPSREDWLDLENEARAVRDELLEILEHIDPTTLDEAQLEERWIRPVLVALGHHFAVQVKVRYRQNGYRKPDYVLAPSEDMAAQYGDRIYAPEDLNGLLAVMDAKRHGVNFDQAGHQGRNPSLQIDEYLRHSELPWGILTDGQTWRLYERQSSKNNIYYAVDLFELLRAGDSRPFTYFYAFFRREAFTEGFLEDILEGSVEYAQRVGGKLEDQIYEALELIAQGFLDYRRNNLRPPTPKTLHTIYEESLVFLYRVLFILYAESRDILPMRENRAYREQYSLSAIKREVARCVNESHHPDSSVFYTRLSDLFSFIDKGDPRLELPCYNGRLFSGDQHPFLRDHHIGDEYLVPAIDRIARVAVKNPHDPRETRLEYVDYRDLAVRHLGAIYEKLLEYQLDIANVPLAVKNGQYIEAGTGDMVVKQPGQVLLRTGSNERKVTGSYYTPDYIVRFIVEHTIEPLLTGITEQYAYMDEQGDWQIDDGQAEALRKAILDVNILDPATGSGHFLVEVTHYIAEWLRDLPVHPEGIAEEEDELAYWKRQVVNSCLYGVDINPLAVELAKLSLWLTTLAKGKPLSFLDHHLKTGNSLVGAWARELGVEVLETVEQEQRFRNKRDRAISRGQSNFLSHDDFFAPVMKDAIAQMADIEGIVAESVDEVKQQERLYAALLERVKPWEQVANMYTARYEGFEVTQSDWNLLRGYLIDGKIPDHHIMGEWIEERIELAELIAQEHRFLHWELAFPEVFYDPNGEPKDNPGFHAIVGNPPYVRQERITPIKDFLNLKYEVYSGTADLFLYFFELGLRSLRQGERLGYITSGTYYNSNSARQFRQYIDKAATFETVVNFGENQPFKGAEMVYPTIAIIRKAPPEETFRYLFIEGTTIPDSLDKEFDEKGIEVLSEVTNMNEWRFQSRELTELFEKLNDGGRLTLEQLVDGQIFYGIKTGFNRAFIIDRNTRNQLIAEHPSSKEIIKPMLRGRHLRPWYHEDTDEYLIFANAGIDIDRYPAIKRHLEQFKPSLMPKPDNWDDGQEKWAGRSSTGHEWYELQGGLANPGQLELPKILWAEISKLPRFCLDDQGFYINNSCYFAPSTSYSIMAQLALMQSRVSWFYLSQIAIPLRLRAGLWQYKQFKQFIERLPVPEVPEDQVLLLAEIGETITAHACDRYQLHEQVRHRLTSDFGTEDGKLNTRLQQWWRIKSMDQFQREVEKSFGVSVPVGDRDEWEKYLEEKQNEHNRLTAAIIQNEVDMNAIVYDAFGLDDHERGLIEAETKYPYGAV